MSLRRSYTLIVSCLLFTSLLFASIELGEGLKCYICDGRNSDCVNSLGKSEDCPLMTTTTQPSTNLTTESTQPSTNLTTESTQPSTNPTTESTQSSTNPTTESTQSSTNPTTTTTTTTTTSTTPPTTTNSLKQGPELDFIDNDWLKEGENITYECVEARLTTLNGTTLKNEVYRGCTPKNLVSCSRIPISDIQVKSCVIRTCETDNCNSSSMEKMGIISLLLPLITALLRIR